MLVTRMRKPMKSTAKRSPCRRVIVRCSEPRGLGTTTDDETGVCAPTHDQILRVHPQSGGERAKDDDERSDHRLHEEHHGIALDDQLELTPASHKQLLRRQSELTRSMPSGRTCTVSAMDLALMVLRHAILRRVREPYTVDEAVSERPLLCQRQ